jgi:hypothetical protein
MSWLRWTAPALAAVVLAGCGSHDHDLAATEAAPQNEVATTTPDPIAAPGDEANHGGHDHGGDAPTADATMGPDGRWRTTYGDLVEVSAFAPGTEADAGQRQSADRFVAAVAQAAARFGSLADAQALGYIQHPGLDAYHWVNIGFTNDGAVLDPTRPEFVMFDPDTGQFLGVMFLAPPDTTGPQFGGPLTVWHYHDNTQIGEPCFDGSLPLPGAFDADAGSCTTGTYRATSPEMLHVWLLAKVANPFASDMALT